MHVDLHNIHKSFGPVRANDGVDMTLTPGRIHGLLGENGAGKTTLMKILSGYQAPDAGDIRLDGQRVTLKSPAEAIQAGIGMLHQDPLDFPPMTALDNFLLGFSDRLRPRRAAARRVMRDIAAQFDFFIDPYTPVERMTVGERQQLEIVRLLALGADVIILDEPTTGISAPQKVRLFATLRRLAKEEGKAIVFVSHKLEEVEALCDEITVLRQGQVTGHREMPVPVETFVRLMFGQSIALPDKPDLPLGEPIFTADAMTIVHHRLTVTAPPLVVREGEVLGFAGMEGSGQALYLRALAGLIRPQQGAVRLQGKTMTGRIYRQFLEAGISLLPADRIDEGLVRTLTIAEHVPFRRETPFFIDWEENQTYTERQIDFYNIKGQPDTPVDALSGGNQQRVLLALQPPGLRVLILEHPTRGLDMESARWVWEQLLKRREGGAAILFTSADLDEVMTYSDRVAVFFNGELTNIQPAAALTVEALGYLIGGKSVPDQPTVQERTAQEATMTIRQRFTYEELLTLRQSEAYDRIRAALQERHWQEVGRQTLGDMEIVQWTPPDADATITVEHGPGYDASLIYQTPDAAAYEALTDPIDLQAFKRQAEREGEVYTCQGYRAGDEMLILAQPRAGVNQPYTVILTTLSNFDALWFESEYLT